MFKLGAIDFADPASGYVVTGNIDRKMPTPKRIVRQNPFADVDRQVANVLNGICEWTVPIRIVGVGSTPALSGADMMAKVAALNAELTKVTTTSGASDNTLVDALDYSGAPQSTFRVWRSPPIFFHRTELTEKRHVYDDKILIYTDPFGTGDPLDIGTSSSEVTITDMVPLGLLQGDLDAPLTITVNADRPLNAVTCAIARPGTTLADYLLPLGDDGAARVTQAGRFRALALVSDASPNARIGVSRSVNLLPAKTKAVTAGALHDIGAFSSLADSRLHLHTTSGAAKATHVILVPSDISVAGVSRLTEQSSVTIDGRVKAPLGDHNLLIVVDPPDAIFTSRVSYRPRWWAR